MAGLRPSGGHESDIDSFKDKAMAPAPSEAINVTSDPSDTEDDHAMESVGSDTTEETPATAYERIKKQMAKPQNDLTNIALTETIGTPVLCRRSQSPLRNMQRLQQTSSPPFKFGQPSSDLPSPNRRLSQATSESDITRTAQFETRSRLNGRVMTKKYTREVKEREARQGTSNESNMKKSMSPSNRNATRSSSCHNSSADEDLNARGDAVKETRTIRKASKKALEDMTRETQRISRNMQLTHQATTKTKFTAKDLLKKFNYRQPKQITPLQNDISAVPGSSSPIRGDSDGQEVHLQSDTPPSSPSSHTGSTAVRLGTLSLPPPLSSTYTYECTSPRRRRASAVVNTVKKSSKPSLKWFLESINHASAAVVGGDDDELEVVDSNKHSGVSILDSLPGRSDTEHQSLQVLRALAHLNDTNLEKRLKSSMTASEMKTTLARRAREQAKTMEQEKIQEARARGKYLESAEEKERSQMYIESMIERAQRENAELAKRERESANQEGTSSTDHLLDSEGDEDEDEEFAPSDEEEVQLSGSDDEESAKGSEGADSEWGREKAPKDVEFTDGSITDTDEAEGARANVPFTDDGVEDDEGSRSGCEGSALPVSPEAQGSTSQRPETPKPRLPRKRRVVEDDSEDEMLQQFTPAPEATKTPGSKTSIAQAFGFQQHHCPSVGLSQLWGGTLAESQTQRGIGVNTRDSQEDSWAFLRGLPQAEPRQYGDAFQQPTQSNCVQDSQPVDSVRSPILESRAVELNSQAPDPETESEASPVFNATQDVGFQKGFSPAAGATVSRHGGEYSTVDTVMLPSEVSPVGPRHAFPDIQAPWLDHEKEDRHSTDDEASDIGPPSAFAGSSHGAKRTDRQLLFNKQKSEARAMVEDQAEESEDEYAGLGGASDDDSGGEMDDETRKLINDDSTLRFNHRKTAEFHAKWERDRDTKDTTKLYRDIATGGLRRQRDNGAALFDWDDDDEREARRRAIRQRKEARQRKALIDSGKLEAVANNPRRQAFMSAVEDFAGDDEVMFLGDERDHSQSYEPEVLSMSTKRGRHADEASAQSDHDAAPPPKSRRRTNASHQQSALDVKRTLSSLIDEATEGCKTNIIEDHDQVLGAYSAPVKNGGSGHIHNASDKENESDIDIDSLPSHRRSSMRTTNPPRHARRSADPARIAVIDRMALKRQGSSAQASHKNGCTRLAFEASSASSYRKPSLLRRATTNASVGGESNLAEKSVAAGITGQAKEKVRMGGSKKSSVNWHAREMERRGRVDQGERERREGREIWKGAAGQKSGLDGLGSGGFE